MYGNKQKGARGMFNTMLCCGDDLYVFWRSALENHVGLHDVARASERACATLDLNWRRKGYFCMFV
jgi:hypothetical protein